MAHLPASTVATVNALTARWALTHRRGNNALSGVGCWILLAMLASGAGGPARSELETALGLPADVALEAASAVSDLLDTMTAVQVAVRIWARVVLDPEWTDGLPPGTIGQLTDDPEADQDAIDRWMSEVTDGQLRELPLQVSEESLLLLASALTVGTDWLEPFDTAGSFDWGPWADQPVTRLVSTTDDLDRLQVVETGPGPLTVVRVPGEDQIDVFLVRGGAGTDPSAVLAAGIGAVADSRADRRGTTASGLPEGEPGPGVRIETISADVPGTTLSVETAAFAIRADHDLLDDAHVFGLDTATDRSRGHFPGISARPLAVGQARQSVGVEFSELGFRATALTAVDVMTGSARPGPTEDHEVRRVRVSFDRPFGFVAVHRPSSLVLTAGWVDRPLSNARTGRPRDGARRPVDVPGPDG